MIESADIAKDNAKGAAKNFFPQALVAVEGGFELRWQWRAATDVQTKRYKNKSATRNEEGGYSLISSELSGPAPLRCCCTRMPRAPTLSAC